VIELMQTVQDRVEKKGGVCIKLMGNHEETGLRFFAGVEDFSRGGLFYPDRTYTGIWTLARQLGYGESCNEIISRRRPEVSRGDPKALLRLLKQNPAGQRVIQHFLELQLLHQSGSIIFTHTPPTGEMLEALDSVSVQELNRIFKRGVRAALDEGTQTEGEELEYEQYCEIFLNPSNRRYSVPPSEDPLWEASAERGHNTFVFGHDNNSAGERKCANGRVTLMGLDHGYGRLVNGQPDFTGPANSAWIIPA
jgi:hypothetical protein